MNVIEDKTIPGGGCQTVNIGGLTMKTKTLLTIVALVATLIPGKIDVKGKPSKAKMLRFDDNATTP